MEFKLIKNDKDNFSIKIIKIIIKKSCDLYSRSGYTGRAA
jgi:hypothetical protein